MNFEAEENTAGDSGRAPAGGPPAGVLSRPELDVLRGDIPLDDDAFMAELLESSSGGGGDGDGVPLATSMRLGRVFLEEYERSQRMFGEGVVDAGWGVVEDDYGGLACAAGYEHEARYENSDEPPRTTTTTTTRRRRRRRLLGVSRLVVDGDGDDDGAESSSSSSFPGGAVASMESDFNNETDGTALTCEPDSAADADYTPLPPPAAAPAAEQITPTYINMMFNATSMIPLANVGKMLKDEPIERINEEYETGRHGDRDGDGDGRGAHYYDDFGRCIPVVDFYSMDLEIS